MSTDARYGLASKFQLLTLTLIIGTAFCVAALSLHRFTLIHKQNLESHGVELAGTLASNAEFAAFSRDPDSLAQVVSAVRGSEALIYVAVLDPEMKPLVSRTEGPTIPALARGAIAARYTVREMKGEAPWFDIVAPIVSGGLPGLSLEPGLGEPSGELLGYVQLGLTQRSLVEGARSMVAFTLLATCGAVLIGALATVLVTRRIIQPLLELQAAVHRVAEGRLDKAALQSIVVSSDDELSDLASSFNHMLARLRESDREVRAHRANLEALVERRTRQLRASTEEALAANRAKSQFLANMSHEIRTPMNGVLGMTELLQQTRLSRVQGRYARTIHSSGKALLGLINQILDFSKIEVGRLELDDAPFGLRALLEDVVGLFSERAEARGLILDYALDEGVPLALRGDLDRLRQILNNLVSNAIKFTDAGSVMVRVSYARDERSYTIGEPTLLRFEVVDTGCGIAQPDQSRLFQPFVQVDDSMSRRFGGTGLGLAICRELSEMMGGEVGLNSQRGAGSTFWFTANLAVREGVAIAPEELAGRRVLVVDDNPVNLEIMTRRAQALGLVTDIASEADAAFDALVGAAASGRPYEVVLLDMMLSDANELVARLATRTALSELSVVICSAPGEVPEPSRTQGIAAVLSKPILSGDLRTCLLDILGEATADEPPPEGGVVPLRGRVLVVEDNEVNQMVAEDLLKTIGCEVQVCSGGQEGLALLQRERFDAVLMDCQMPVWSGYHTTGEIRRWEAQEAVGARVPIIALTAHALAGERQRCIDAGMDDYLSKPFSMLQLHATLSEWLPEIQRAEPGPQPSGAQPSGAQRSALRAASPASSDAVYDRIVAAWLLNSRERMDSLLESAAEGDCASVARLAHTLKSSSHNVGAIALSASLRGLEAMALKGSLSREAIVAIAEHYEDTRAALLGAGGVEGPTSAVGRRALIIDDDETVRILAGDACERAGFAAEGVSDGPAGLAAFDRQRPDVVLLDVQMDGMDGFEVCRHLRTRSPGGRVPVVIMTGLDDDASIASAYEAGAADFVTKPFNPSVLARRLQFVRRASDAAARLSRSESNLSTAQRLAGLGSWLDEPGAAGLECSPVACRILGHAQAPTDQRELRGHIHPEDRESVARHLAQLREQGDALRLRYRVTDPSGEERVVEEQAEALLNEDGEVIGYMGAVMDITARVAAEAEIERLAYVDLVTGLPNRQRFVQVAGTMVAQAQAESGRLAMLFIDLDRFKWVNDTMGHPVGDELLRGVAERLKGALVPQGERRHRLCELARFGGDEFTVITQVRDREEAGQVAELLLESILEPISLGDQEVVTGASVGIGLYPEDGTSVDTLMQAADTAMYVSKGAGGGTWRFSPTRDDSAFKDRLALEADLRGALEREEFELYYQPRVDLVSGAIRGCEALIRWNHPERGRVSPGVFIPIAEDTGIIVPIGEWVLREACNQVRSWRDIGMDLGYVSVNLSARQFSQVGLAETVSSALSQAGLPPEVLELEVTETAVMGDVESAITIMERLKSMGVSLAIDDFGTGHSSLNYLMRFPADVLKIDRSFVMHVADDKGSAAIASAIVALGRTLGMRVVAEGVETQEQRDFLTAEGCEEAQGYLFARPLDAAAFAALLMKKAA